MKTANRLDSVQEYYFSKKLREVKQMTDSGLPVINMGIGSPDLLPPKEVTEALIQSVTDVGANKYQSYQGLPELRNAMANFYEMNYGVSLNPTNEILPLIGSKEGIFHISMAFLNPGDEVLIPNPGYPTYTSVTSLVEAKPRFYDLIEEEAYFPNLSDLETQDLSKVKMMWVNYPHMPTGAKASKKQLEQLVHFAKKHNILLINDNPYSFILNSEPLSILSVSRSDQNVLELNSLSKTFNMAGWRVGMVVGNSDLLSQIITVKSNMDSGMFYCIQKGAIKALEQGKDWFDQLNKIYEKRKKLVTELAQSLDCTTKNESSGLFVWAKLPKHETDSEQYIDELLQNKHIFVAPGTIFGDKGQGYIRFSLCVPEDSIQEAINRVNS